MKIAHVYFTKEVEKDNWNYGVTGERTLSYSEQMTVEFENTEELKEKLADFITSGFDVFHNDFIEYGEFDNENNSFIYSQNEDEDNNKIDLTEFCPNGYLCGYTFYIEKVTQEIEYTF
ncbi:hypothetical protein [Bacillus thuringiensis]|uniref:hypothetical protein n=1 Tax=Bacillus thuringiensis TaxID=1428 RepID=UPI000BFA8FCD|nr:hypothetical protein [Bacillus thuringiensis]PFC28574.1 hypothetical protein CN299_20095 [Bacillus thuringiensis]